jgi:hypothetical protein
MGLVSSACKNRRSRPDVASATNGANPDPSLRTSIFAVSIFPLPVKSPWTERYLDGLFDRQDCAISPGRGKRHPGGGVSASFDMPAAVSIAIVVTSTTDIRLGRLLEVTGTNIYEFASATLSRSQHGTLALRILHDNLHRLLELSRSGATLCGSLDSNRRWDGNRARS